MLLRPVSTFEQWRDAARPLLTAGVSPAAIEWGDAAALRRAAGAGSAADVAIPVPGNVAGAQPPRISASLMRLLEAVAQYRDAGRWELMYRLAWRSISENPRLLDDAADADVRNASLMERAVRRDIHKMHAFVRFREDIEADGSTAYFSWFEPEHEILRSGARFFVKRFPNMHWTIATPDGAAVWNGDLVFIDGPRAADGPQQDPYESLWRAYYRSICNVARMNPMAMQREMPRRYWRHLPEAAEIGPLLRHGREAFDNRQRESTDGGIVMTKAVRSALAAPVAAGEGIQNCRRCELWKHATQAVVGEGAEHAAIMLVGEQPGDEEDLRGRPFVGPAGKVLDQALTSAEIDRRLVFVTNAVKHFKWEPRGKRRLHKKPDTAEIKACNIWLEGEIAAGGPRVIVALGASALRALTGKTLSIEASRQQELQHASGARILATYHPSAILRAEGGRIEELRAHLLSDLRQAVRIAAALA